MDAISSFLSLTKKDLNRSQFLEAIVEFFNNNTLRMVKITFPDKEIYTLEKTDMVTEQIKYTKKSTGSLLYFNKENTVQAFNQFDKDIGNYLNRLPAIVLKNCQLDIYQPSVFKPFSFTSCRWGRYFHQKEITR